MVKSGQRNIIFYDITAGILIVIWLKHQFVAVFVLIFIQIQIVNLNTGFLKWTHFVLQFLQNRTKAVFT